MIIRRAFIREVLHACGAVGVVLLAVFLTARSMGFLRQAVDGDIPGNAVLLLLALKTVAYLDILIPLVLYVAMLSVIGRWIRDNELTVLHACGVGIAQLLRPAMRLTAVAAAVAAAFSLYLSPLSAEVSREIVDGIKQRAQVSAAMPGVFHQAPGGVYFAEAYDAEARAYQNIFIHHRDAGGEMRVAAAEAGRIAGAAVDKAADSDFLRLQNGGLYRARAGESRYVTMRFEEYGLRLQSPAKARASLPAKAMSTFDLWMRDDAESRGELHWRISKVALLPALALFALALSAIKTRGSRFSAMLIALLVYFVYSNLLGFALALGRRAAMHPGVALWAVHAAFFALGGYWLYRRNRGLGLLAN